jgi:acetyltransferase-like isoleucine patch superfamily enzyme/acyl carrier protein
MNDIAVPRGGLARPALRRLQGLASAGLSRLALGGVDQVGARPRVAGMPFIENLGTITIGDDVELLSGPVRSHLVTGPRGVLRIRSGVTIGGGAAISAQELVEIGEGAHLGASVMLLDTDYHAAGDKGAAGATAPIVIGAHAWLGDGVMVLRGSTIGRYARVEPGSVVSGPIPDGALAAGNPARAPKPAREAGVEEALSARILRIGAEVFALPRAPEPSDGPATIPAWDSLGALRLLVSIEEELGLTLPPGSLAGVRDFKALADVVARARAGGTPRTACP